MVWRNINDCVKAVPLRRHLLMASLLTVLRSVPGCLISRCCCRWYRLWYHEAVLSVRAAFRYAFLQPTNVIGSNTIAIYTTHRILVEISA